jgi:hypothetical protein
LLLRFLWTFLGREGQLTTFLRKLLSVVWILDPVLPALQAILLSGLFICHLLRRRLDLLAVGVTERQFLVANFFVADVTVLVLNDLPVLATLLSLVCDPSREQRVGAFVEIKRCLTPLLSARTN